MALAHGPIANALLRMITVRLKRLPTVLAAAILHQAAPDANERNSFSLEAPLTLSPAQKLPHIETIELLLLHRRLRRLFQSLAVAESAVHLDRNVRPPERRHHYVV